MEQGAKGENVRRLQSQLVDLGYALPRWGIDGHLGLESLDAFARFCRDHGTDMDDDPDEISDAEMALLDRVHRATQLALAGPTLLGGAFVDLRAVAEQNRIGGRRPWTKITGITLHQTACVLGERPQRWQGIGAHLGVTRAGQVIWLHDFEKIVWHANGFNASTVGIEMDGTYAGVEGDDRTLWRPAEEPHRQAQTPTEQLVSAAQATIKWICDRVQQHGGVIKQLLAHRQSSRQRQSDPGSGLWRRVALPLLRDERLALSDGGKGYVVGDGMPIPERWDEQKAGIAY